VRGGLVLPEARAASFISSLALNIGILAAASVIVALIAYCSGKLHVSRKRVAVYESRISRRLGATSDPVIPPVGHEESPIQALATRASLLRYLPQDIS
jgi:hypothetical protein